MDTITIYANPIAHTTTKIIDTSVRVDNNPYRLKAPEEKRYTKETKTTTTPGKPLVTYTCENNTIGKTLRWASEVGIDLTNADLSGADLSNEIFGYIHLNWANFDGANLTNTIFHNSFLNHAKLINCKAQYSIFYNVMMDTVNFYNSDFKYGDIIVSQADGFSHFVKTDFTGASHFVFRHRGAITSGWKVGKNGQGHEWKGEIYDWKPQWPSKEEINAKKDVLRSKILNDLKHHCYPGLFLRG